MNWISAGELESIKVGHAMRIPRKAAVALAGGDGYEMPVLLTVEQVAGLLRLDKQTVYNWIDASSLPALNVGGRRVRIKRTELDHVAGEGFMMAASDLAPTDSADDFRLGTKPVGEPVSTRSLTRPSEPTELSSRRPDP